MDHDELVQWIVAQSNVLYPDFAQDEPEMVDSLVNTAIAFIGDRKQELVRKDKAMYNQIMLYIVLMLEWQIDHMEGTATAAKAGSIDIELANGANPFANTLKMFLELIGWNVWKARFL